MSPAGVALPEDLRDAVAALERAVTAQLRDELAGAGARRGELAQELGRRRDDYRTWHRMDEVPDRVTRIAGQLVRGDAGRGLQRALELSVLAAMVRAHEQALGATAQDDGQAEGPVRGDH